MATTNRMFATPYIVYKTTNLLNGMIYVGVHIQKEERFDGYFGSNKHLRRAIRKYGKDNFIRTTLMSDLTKEEAYEIEKLLVCESIIKRVDVYNEKVGGFGGSSQNREFHKSNEYRAKLRESAKKYKERLLTEGKDHPQKGKKYTEEERQKYFKNNGHREKWYFGEHTKGFDGKHHSPESRSKISESLLEYYKHNKKNSLSEEAKARISIANSGRIPHNKGKKLDDETILAKMRKPRKTRTCPHCGKTGRGGNMSRYHFDNCEENDDV